MTMIRTVLAFLLASVLAGCGYNEIQSKTRGSSRLGRVISQYQRRADLIPNIVNTVKARRISSRRRSPA